MRPEKRSWLPPTVKPRLESAIAPVLTSKVPWATPFSMLSAAERLASAYGRAIAVEGVIDVNAPDASAATALVVLGAAAVVAAWAATRRFTRTELP